MRFTRLYEELKFDDVFAPASKEEVADRKLRYGEIIVKEILDNDKKTRLEDGSWSIDGDLNIQNCGLNNLKNLKSLNISKVTGSFYCYHNQLTSLEGAPKEVGRDFCCGDNKLTSLEGCPKEVRGDFSCSKNIKKFTEKEVKSICRVKSEILV